jgi:pilus assembly protein FimV
MTRKLALVFAVAALMVSGRAFALGLGEITLNSALNQKLDAEIELLEVRGLDENEILASLGSREDFERVGVERFFFLTDLRFRVEMRDAGRAVLVVTSSSPITEPYLNFLVEVLWPSGRLLKEFTLLLDPPTFTDSGAAPVAVPARGDQGGGPAGRVERGPSRPDSQVTFTPPPPSSSTPQSAPRTTQQERLAGDTYGMTDRDDTLWTIAASTRASGAVSVQQNMLAITRMNPEAFIGGNINLLKAGYRLQLPNEDAALALTQKEAVAEVASQNSAWQAYRRGGGLAALGVAASEPPAAAEQPSSLAGQMDATSAPGAQAPAVSGPEGELRIVAADATGEGAGTAGGAAAAGEIQALSSELASSEEERDRIGLENEELVGRLDQMTAEVQQLQRQLEVRDQQITQLQQSVAEAPAAPAAPPAEEKPAAGGGILDLLASPFVMIGAGLLVILLLVLGLVAARRRRAEAQDGLDVYEEQAVVQAAFDEPVQAVAEADEDDTEFGATLADEFDDETLDEEVEEPETLAEAEEETGTAQTSDVIGEADIYIAYGRYPQAVSLLLGAIDEDPDRSEVRLKLLEVYAETKDEQGFEQHMAELVERCDDQEILLVGRELEAKLRGDDDTEVAGAAATVDAGPASLDDLADVDEDVAGVVDDFELTLEDDEPQSSGPALELVSSDNLDEEDSRSADDLGGDLGMDFNPDAEVSAEEDAVIEGGDATLEAVEEADEAPAEDEEFNLDDLELDAGGAGDTQAATLVRPAETDVASAPADQPTDEEVEDAFDFLDEEDAASTKLDLARAYIDMGDEDGAREILSEVISEGTGEQQEQANELLERLG